MTHFFGCFSFLACCPFRHVYKCYCFFLIMNQSYFGFCKHNEVNNFISRFFYKFENGIKSKDNFKGRIEAPQSVHQMVFLKLSQLEENL